MTTKTFAYGTLGASTDTWFLVARERMILLDVSFLIDGSVENKFVSVIGKMGVPPGSPFTKLIAEKIVSHEAIARQAYEIFQSGHGGSPIATGSAPNRAFWAIR